MQKLYYASGFVLLSDTMCDVVMEYAKALADTQTSDLVVIPSLSDEGLRGTTRLLLGPASQIFAAPAMDRGVDLEDDEAVARMTVKIAHLQPARGRAMSQEALAEDNPDFHSDY
jgi:hypothetical protein